MGVKEHVYKRLAAYILLIPSFSLIFLFVYYPAINTLIISFYNLNLKIAYRSKFIGFDNYFKVILNKEFHRSAINTLVFLGFTLLMCIPMGLVFALVLNERFPLRSLVRSIVILPWAIPPVVNGYMWQWILNGQYGAFNGLLYQLGIINKYVVWLAHPLYSIFWCSFVQAWREIPFVAIVLLAALQSIPAELIDSSKVDGANTFQRFRYITLPLLRPALSVIITLEAMTTFTAFDVIYALTDLDPATRTLMLLNYQLVFKFLDIGYGAALSYILFAVGLLLSYFYMKTLYKRIFI
ncbi:MAG: sugar ABC transporter permease [Thermoprotei archaeon]|nr:MAG: sugar ABC transporter permease [Thermoprotei archaeon]